ncbi:uncharacterized protein LOC123364116 isoform X2 [Mauremys mutica]|nr:uncharacterized protein LOC123364116 isoform X2 [Mauremys mutica]
MVIHRKQSLRSIPWLLLPSLQASQEDERMACSVLLAEFLGSPLLKEKEPKAMRKQVVKAMLQRTEDSNIHIRGRALHGLRNAVTEFPDKVGLEWQDTRQRGLGRKLLVPLLPSPWLLWSRLGCRLTCLDCGSTQADRALLTEQHPTPSLQVRKKQDQILGSFVCAVCECCDPRAVLDAMEGLCWMLPDPKASLKAHVAVPLALQAREQRPEAGLHGALWPSQQICLQEVVPL